MALSPNLFCIPALTFPMAACHLTFRQWDDSFASVEWPSDRKIAIGIACPGSQLLREEKMKLDVDFDKKREITVGDSGRVRFRLRDISVEPGKAVSLKKDFAPDFTGGYNDKAGALKEVSANVQRLSAMQEVLYAQDIYSLLIIFQAMDAAGKDGAIRHVMSGVNPQGCQVTSFKAPSAEDLDHGYLWRASKALPARGMIGIFNRSYYEEVLVVRVHPELLEKQKLPPSAREGDIWQRRFKEINNFEKYLRQNGTIVLKFFLNVSKKEQKRRFLSRIDEPEKNWKFSHGGLRRAKILGRLPKRLRRHA